MCSSVLVSFGRKKYFLVSKATHNTQHTLIRFELRTSYFQLVIFIPRNINSNSGMSAMSCPAV